MKNMAKQQRSPTFKQTIHSHTKLHVLFCLQQRKISHVMRKPTFYIGENNGADQLRSKCTADHASVFASLIVQFLYLLNLKLPAFSHLLCLNSLLCVGPVRKPHCWFSHDVAQIYWKDKAILTKQVRQKIMTWQSTLPKTSHHVF